MKTAGAPQIVVGMCTFRRIAGLGRALDHVAVSIRDCGTPVAVVVVDNDGNDPAVAQAVATFKSASGLDVTYQIEKTPGIAAAREAVFRIASARGAALLAMLDDDEWPSEGWLAALLAEQRRTQAVVVGGPAVPVFPPAASHLQRWARFWSVDKQMLDGRPFVFASSNFLVDLRAIGDVARPLFDTAFGLSGGEDVVFFRRLFDLGHPMAWSDAAIVFEEVPPDRASLAWMRRRRFAVGNNAVRWERLRGPRRALTKTLGLTVRLLAYPLWRREPEAPWVGWALEAEKVRGRYAAHLGAVTLQYGASRPGKSKS